MHEFRKQFSFGQNLQFTISVQVPDCKCHTTASAGVAQRLQQQINTILVCKSWERFEIIDKLVKDVFIVIASVRKSEYFFPRETVQMRIFCNRPSCLRPSGKCKRRNRKRTKSLAIRTKSVRISLFDKPWFTNNYNLFLWFRKWIVRLSISFRCYKARRLAVLRCHRQVLELEVDGEKTVNVFCTA